MSLCEKWAMSNKAEWNLDFCIFHGLDRKFGWSVFSRTRVGNWVKDFPLYTYLFSLFPNFLSWKTFKLIWANDMSVAGKCHQNQTSLLHDSLRKKSPNTKFFLVRTSAYLDWIRGNTEQKNSVFRLFSCSNFWQDKDPVLVMIAFSPNKSEIRSKASSDKARFQIIFSKF